MQHRLDLPRHRHHQGGFSLIELLVATLVTSIMLALTTGFFQTTSATKINMSALNEAQQGLRAFLSVLSQEIRQAGVCLPTGGQLLPVQGTDNGTQDSLTVLIGHAQPVTSQCVWSSPPNNNVVAAGSTSFAVRDANAGFQVGDYVYILPGPGVAGSFHTLTAVAGTTLTFTPALPVALSDTSTVTALDSRVYRINAVTYGRPVLTVAMNGGAAQPLVDGVEVFDLIYLGNCTASCVQLAQPATPTQWAQVRQIGIKGTVRSLKRDKQGAFVRETTGRVGDAGEFVNISLRTQRAVNN